jgi:gamma-glutamylcyclotransferase (GGCT)/AIG2-like uncharacterized protein YtfP
MSGTFLLFVYGTLKRGGVRHVHLAGQRFLGEAVTLPRYALIDLGDYPGMVSVEDGQAVHGELYEVSRELIPTLDRVERAPSLFALGPVGLDGHDGVLAYLYMQEPPGRPRITSGRWDNG